MHRNLIQTSIALDRSGSDLTFLKAICISSSKAGEERIEVEMILIDFHFPRAILRPLNRKIGGYSKLFYESFKRKHQEAFWIFDAFHLGKIRRRRNLTSPKYYAFGHNKSIQYERFSDLFFTLPSPADGCYYGLVHYKFGYNLSRVGNSLL